MGNLCERKTEVCEELRKRRDDVWCMQEVAKELFCCYFGSKV